MKIASVPPPARSARRRFLIGAGLGALALPGVGGCASAGAQAWPFEVRLGGDTLALLGEVHDNPLHHGARATVLRRALQAGWRPAFAMEQFDVERQADIERSRRERPHDAQHLIEQAAAPRSGWEWPHYRPFIELALQFELPLLAANLPRAQAMRLAREGHAAVLGEARTHALGLHRPLDPALQAAHEEAIGASHCGALPPNLWPGMARAQAARDALMAHTLAQQAARGAVLIAGNGHVRRDVGVPRWLHGVPAGQVLAVGFIEEGTEVAPGQFDAVVVTAAAKRDDPCAAWRARRAPVR